MVSALREEAAARGGPAEPPVRAGVRPLKFAASEQAATYRFAEARRRRRPVGAAGPRSPDAAVPFRLRRDASPPDRQRASSPNRRDSRHRRHAAPRSAALLRLPPLRDVRPSAHSCAAARSWRAAPPAASRPKLARLIQRYQHFAPAPTV